MTERLLRLEEAADVLGVSVRTLRRRVAAGALPVFRDGGVVRVREVDLRRYVAERVTLSTPATRAVPAGRALVAGGRLWD